MGGGGAAGADAAYGIPTQGPSGWRGLIQNKKALGLATFASLGGVLYVSLDLNPDVVSRRGKYSAVSPRAQGLMSFLR